MTTPSPDRLYELLPFIYRMRDKEQGEPLRALLQIIAEQVDHVEHDIAQLYENWFIETCEEWVVPYIADLIGYRPVANTAITGVDASAVAVPRHEVANTIRNRSRKGTLALLELLGRDVASWPTRAVEFYTLLAINQHLNHRMLHRGRTVDLRHGDALERIDGPFDETAHTLDLRRIDSQQTPGRYTIANVGLFVWRLKPYSVSRAPAHCIDRVRNQYTFSLLGNDTPLFTLPVDEPDPTHIADEINVPAPLRYRAFEDRMADYYGPGKSLYIWRDTPDQPVPIEQIVATDLSTWAYKPQPDEVAVDPVLGRIAFPARMQPKTGVWVTYQYGFSDDIGGGEYQRWLRSTEPFVVATQQSEADEADEPDDAPEGNWLYHVGEQAEFPSINAALERWKKQRPQDAIIEIVDSAAYVEQIDIDLMPGQRLELRAASRTRPVIRLLDFYTNRPDAMRIVGQPPTEGAEHPARLTLDGLMITGRSVQLSGNIGEIMIRHCTLVPGWSISPQCAPESETEPSIELIDVRGPLQIDHTITGSIQISQDEVETDPIDVTITDSILDATRREFETLGAPGCLVAHAITTILRTTVLGRLQVHAIKLAEDSIFDGIVKVARRQHGCMRFCYVPYGSRTPRRYQCQPDLVVSRLEEQAEFATWPASEQDAARQHERDRVLPQFNSVRYGTPTYCQLGPFCASEITSGAEDGAEMGAFHDLYQPQRVVNLLRRVDEYAPAGLDAGIIFVT